MQPQEDHKPMPEPKIGVFLCDKCCSDPPPWSGEDRPDRIHQLRFKCAAEVGPVDVRQTFDEGADGVLILGCLMADCLSGRDHVRALRAIYDNQVLLKNMGLSLQRLRHEWVAPCEATRMGAVLDEFTRDLGKHLAEPAIGRKRLANEG